MHPHLCCPGTYWARKAGPQHFQRQKFFVHPLAKQSWCEIKSAINWCILTNIPTCLVMESLIVPQNSLPLVISLQGIRKTAVIVMKGSPSTHRLFFQTCSKPSQSLQKLASSECQFHSPHFMKKQRQQHQVIPIQGRNPALNMFSYWISRRSQFRAAQLIIAVHFF